MIRSVIAPLEEPVTDWPAPPVAHAERSHHPAADAYENRDPFLRNLSPNAVAPNAAVRLTELPRNSSALEKSLLLRHLEDRQAVQARFGSQRVPQRQRYLIHTVTPEEGFFLAAYLGVPEAHVLKLKTARFAVGRRAEQQIHALVRGFLVEHEEGLREGALTLLGHMSLNAARTAPLFARLPVASLYRALAPLHELRPSFFNFFSCSSLDYSRQLATLFAEGGTCFAYRTAVRDEVEVSQWPKRAQRGKPLRMFYAGPEIGRMTRTFDANLHGPILPALVTETSSEADGGACEGEAAHWPSLASGEA